MQKLLEDTRFINLMNSFDQIDFENQHVYRSWLSQTYHFVCHSQRLTALAAGKLDIYDKLSNKMLSHIGDEAGHHFLALKDLKNVGGDIEEYPELGITKAFYESQYYKIMFEHPHHLLGQILVLEAMPALMGDKLYKRLIKTYPENSLTFLKVHVYEDEKHYKKAIEACNSCSPSEQLGIVKNFFQAIEVYSLLLQQVALFGRDLKSAEAA